MSRDKVLTYLSIGGGAVVLLGAAGTAIAFLIGATIDDKLSAANPASVVALTQEVALLRNDYQHLSTDVQENTATVNAFDEVFREYLQRQAEANQ
jgi:hypothetical protein